MYRLGIIGMSEGNGHPYSWAAIFNGYNYQEMVQCPFPAIPDYLSRQRYPQDFLSCAKVTHIWCQDRQSAEMVARAALIDIVVDQPEDMLGQVDGLLLARDDSENHLRFAAPFLSAGIPVYIDKPLAVSVAAAKRLISIPKEGRCLFSCSALRYARELALSEAELHALGRPVFVDAWVPKKWETYAVHVIEPLIAQLPAFDKVVSHALHRIDDVVQLEIEWRSGLKSRFTAFGQRQTDIGFRILGTKGVLEKRFENSFAAFRTALEKFIGVAMEGGSNIPRDETLKVIEIIEMAVKTQEIECR